MRKLLTILTIATSLMSQAYAAEKVVQPPADYLKWQDVLKRQPLPAIQAKKVTLEHVAEINHNVNEVVKYTREKVDYWQTHKETVARKKGDCEDYALAKIYELALDGVDRKDMEFIEGTLYWEGATKETTYFGFHPMVKERKQRFYDENHAVLKVMVEGEPWIMDIRMFEGASDKLVPAAEYYKHFEPRFGFYTDHWVDYRKNAQ